MTDDTPRIIAEVENYIYLRTGKQVKIVFDNRISISRQHIMLMEAYNIAVSYKKGEQTFN